jgi:HSP20 family protein
MPSRTPADSDVLRRHLTGLFSEPGFLPPVDVYATENPQTLHVRVEVAGLDAARTQIRLEGRTLAIEGERSPDHGGRYQHMEISYGRFEREVELPVDVDGAHATASYRAGFLTVSLPVALRRRRRQVVVRVAL